MISFATHTVTPQGVFTQGRLLPASPHCLFPTDQVSETSPTSPSSILWD